MTGLIKDDWNGEVLYFGVVKLYFYNSDEATNRRVNDE